MNYNICKNCKHFMQHYIKSSRLGITPVNCGHCKEKQKITKHCNLFQPSETMIADSFSILNSINDCNNNFINLIEKIENLNVSLTQLNSIIKLFDEKKEP